MCPVLPFRHSVIAKHFTPIQPTPVSDYPGIFPFGTDCSYTGRQLDCAGRLLIVKSRSEPNWLASSYPVCDIAFATVTFRSSTPSRNSSLRETKRCAQPACFGTNQPSRYNKPSHNQPVLLIQQVNAIQSARLNQLSHIQFVCLDSIQRRRILIQRLLQPHPIIKPA